MEVSFSDIVNREDFKWGLLWYICLHNESDYHFIDYLEKHDIESIKHEITEKFNKCLLLYTLHQKDWIYTHFDIMMTRLKKCIICDVYSVDNLVERLYTDFKNMNQHNNNKYFEMLAHAANRLFRNYNQARNTDFHPECHCMTYVTEYFKSINQKCKYGW